jgi:methylated-DNA-protein-cysteine methyltransferase-like protein
VGIIRDDHNKSKLTADNRCFLIQSTANNFKKGDRHVRSGQFSPTGVSDSCGHSGRSGHDLRRRREARRLKKLPEGSTLPWYRVVNRHGEISLQGEDFKRQRQALLAEGIIFQKGKIDLLKYGWKL